jgi:hypothetical protein
MTLDRRRFGTRSSERGARCESLTAAVHGNRSAAT